MFRSAIGAVSRRSRLASSDQGLAHRSEGSGGTRNSHCDCRFRARLRSAMRGTRNNKTNKPATSRTTRPASSNAMAWPSTE